jgi:DNA-binding transcriptional LysR family regulator
MTPLPSPTDLHYFLEVASTANLSRAAERLGVSQPALSLAMRRLEESFGLKLLIRGKTGVQVTHAGRRLAGQARALVQEWEKIRESARREQDEVSGVFALGCHPSVALYSLPGFVPGLLKRHPRLELKLAHDLSRRITEDIVSFRVDFGIVVNPVAHPDLVIQELARDEVALWIAPGAPRSAASTLLYDPDLVQSQQLLKQCDRKGIAFARTLPSSSLEVIAALTAAGAGVGILPTRVAQGTIPRAQSVRLNRLAEDAPRSLDRICLVYRADAQKSRAAKAIGHAIQESFREKV